MVQTELTARAHVRATTAPAAPRTITRRRALPGGRAVAGGFLVAVAAVGIFAAYAGTQQHGRAQYVVAAHDLTAGTRLKATDVALVALDLPEAARRHAFRTAADLDGSLVLGPVARGELVQPGSILPAGKTPPFREVTVAVEAAQTRGITEGDTVDVLVTSGTGEATRTEVVAGGVRVLRVGDHSQGIGGDSKPAVTFALQNFDDVARLVEASHIGSLTLVRANGFPGQAPTFSGNRSAAGEH